MNLPNFAPRCFSHLPVSPASDSLHRIIRAVVQYSDYTREDALTPNPCFHAYFFCKLPKVPPVLFLARR